MHAREGTKPTNRRRFVSWLHEQLTQDGASLKDPFTFEEMKREIDRLYISPARISKEKQLGHTHGR